MVISEKGTGADARLMSKSKPSASGPMSYVRAPSSCGETAPTEKLESTSLRDPISISSVVISGHQWSSVVISELEKHEPARSDLDLLEGLAQRRLEHGLEPQRRIPAIFSAPL